MNKFSSLGLGDQVLKAITEMGFETPTPIQEQTIPMLLTSEDDLVALAQTGTGKTAAFGLPLIELLDFEKKHVQALIMCPTRELCMQITRDLQAYAKYIPQTNVVSIYGGASIDNQIRDVRRGAHIIVGTPGRMVDMINRNVIDLSKVNFVVLDEADEMLNMGFKEDLDVILSKTPAFKSTWLFSATMPNEVLNISRNYMSNPKEVTVGGRNQGNENIEHQYMVVHAKDRYLALKRIADFNPDIFAIVFCRTKIETQQVADALIKDGYNADSIHGDLSQAQRDQVMKRYRSRSLQMLVATDVAARGIDVNDVTHVINYNLPDELENYTHRSGRTARAGKKGVSIVILHMKELFKIRQMEKITKNKFTQIDIPSGFDVCEQQLLALVKRVHNVEVDEKAIERYLPAALAELEELSKEEVVKRFVSMEFNRFLDYYRNAPDLNTQAQHDDRRSQNSGLVKLYTNLGQLDGFDFGNLKQFVADQANINAQDITWTDVKNTFSLIEVRVGIVDQVIEAMNGKSYQGRVMKVESRGNRDAGIPRTRSRGERGSGERSSGERGRSEGYQGGRTESSGKFFKSKDQGFAKKKKKSW